MSHEVVHSTTDAVLWDPVDPQHEVTHVTVDAVLYDPPAPQHEVVQSTTDVLLVWPNPPWIPSYVMTPSGWLPMFNPVGTPHETP